MSELHPVSRRLSWFLNAMLVVFSTLFSLIIVAVVLPQQAKQVAWRLFPPTEVVYLEGMGDVLAYQHDIMRPPANAYHVLAEYPLAWGADGFRIPARPADDYEIAIVGDSFTEGASVARPFADGLATLTSRTVKNLGVRGIGPTEQALLMAHIADEYPVSAIVLQFFGGNDFSDADSYTWRQDFRLPSVWRSDEGETALSTHLWQYPYDDSTVTIEKYPVQAVAGTITHEVNLLEGYLWVYNTTAEEITRSYALAETVRSWQAIDRATDDACVVIMYIPSKEETYLPLIAAADRDRIFDSAYRNTVQKEGDIFRLEADPDLTFDALMPSLPLIGDAVRDAALQQGYAFVDLRPAFNTAARQGAMLYYEYDTHLNQTGHTLAAQILAEANMKCE